MRGVEGFGSGGHRRSDRQLTLSEDLPVVSVAVDRPDRIMATVDEMQRLPLCGLVTLERALLPSVEPAAPATIPWSGHAETKLTVYLGRHERIGPAPAHEAVVALLAGAGLAGASVLLGIDGTAGGERRRAGFLHHNSAVPVMVIAVGDSERVGEVLAPLARLVRRPLASLERVDVCKRDGVSLGAPRHLPDTDRGGLGVWQKLMVYCSEQARYRSRPLYGELIRELLAAGASGATCLRGIWGYHGDHAPHGDRFWQLRRNVPIVTVVIDVPSRLRRWYEIVDRLTAETGLVTSEAVPAFRAGGSDDRRGGLRLAERWTEMPGGWAEMTGG